MIRACAPPSRREAVIGLGSNLGDRAALLRAAVGFLRAEASVEVLAVARVRCTEPVGPPQPAYYNTAVRVRTGLAAEALLTVCLTIEQRLGRVRAERWGARTIDLDLLWIDGEVVASPTLTVPHPELRVRAFALAPLVELCPGARDPRDGTRLTDALATLAPHGESPFVRVFDGEQER